MSNEVEIRIKADDDTRRGFESAKNNAKKLEDHSKQINARFAKLGSGLLGVVRNLGSAAAITASIGSLVGPAVTGMVALGKAIAVVGHNLAAVGPAAAVLPGLAASALLVKATIMSAGPAMLEALKPVTDAWERQQERVGKLASIGLPALGREFVKVNFPAIAKAQDRIAGSINRVTLGVGKWVNSASGQLAIAQITNATATATERLEKPLTRVVISFGELVKRAGSSAIYSAADAMGKLADKTAKWLDSLSTEDIRDALSDLSGWGIKVKETFQVLRDVGSWMQENQGKVKAFSDTLAAAGIALGLATGNIPAILAGSFTLVVNHWEDLKGIFKGAPGFFSDIWNEIKNNPGVRQVFTSLKDAWNEFVHAFQVGLKDERFKEWVSELKKTWDQWAPIIAVWWDEVGKPALTMLGFTLGGLVTILLNLAIVANNVWQFFGDVLKGFVNIALTAFGTFLNAAAYAFGWIPGVGENLKRSAKMFEDYKNSVNASLAGIKDRTVTVRIKEISDVSGRGGRAGGVENYYAHGGIVGGAASGRMIGAGRRVRVGEYGEEEVSLPPGAQVHSNPDTERMDAQRGGGGSAMRIQIGSDGSRLGDLLIDLIAQGVRDQGGNPALLGITI